MNGPEWDDALLADLGRAYRNHPDVADLVAGVRRVLALCEFGIAESSAFIEQHTYRYFGATEPGSVDPESVGYISALERVVRALNHPEESP